MMREVGASDHEKDDANPVGKLLRLNANELQTASVWKETMMSWALIWGNGISWIQRDERGVPVSLFPLLPERTGYWINGVNDGPRQNGWQIQQTTRFGTTTGLGMGNGSTSTRTTSGTCAG